MKLISKITWPVGGCAGTTLMELMVGITLGVLILGTAVSLIIFAAQTFMALGNYDDLNYKSRNALDVMTEDIRQCKHLVSYNSNSTVQQLVFTNLPGSASASFSYNYSNATGSNGTLTRTWGGRNTLLLTNVDSLTFQLSTRNPNNGFTFFPTTDPTVAKLVDVSWSCSRKIYGSKINTESVQTAKIIVRN